MHFTRMKSCFFHVFRSVLVVGFIFSAEAAPLSDAVRGQLAQHPSLSGRRFEVQMPATQRQDECQDWEIELPPRARPLGQLRVQARCPSNPRMSRNFVMGVSLQAQVMVAARDLTPGHVIQPGDWKQLTMDLAKLPTDVAETPSSIENKEIVRNIQAGRPFQLNDLRPITVIKSGDQVKLNFIGQGFSIDASALAMSNAGVGDTVRVRLPDGKVIQGIAVSNGVVEVNLNQR